MSVNNFLNTGGTVTSTGGLPTSQPPIAGTWLNNGILTFFNGTINVPYDLDEGQRTSLFGTDLGDK